jgi:hypothetical protein
MPSTQDQLKQVLGGGGLTGGLDTSQLTNIANNGNLLNQNISQLIQAVTAVAPALSAVLATAIGDAIADAAGFTAHFGSFTCAANTNTTVSDVNVAANSMILWVPTNAAGGTLMGGTRSLYLSLRTAGASFRVTTASGVAAGGTETFIYIIINPT